MTRDEQWFRSHTDDDGILRYGADLKIDEARVFRVFSQEKLVRVRSKKWSDFAERFCETKLGITNDKHYGERIVSADAARVVLSRDDLKATRLIYGREISPRDVGVAEAAESRANYTGLSALAARCKMIWFVEAEGESDRAALLLSAILAGTELGPILYPGGTELTGFKTAWSRFPKDAPPYR